MSLIYIDSFDGYTTAEIGNYWYNNAFGIAGHISTTSSDPRTGTACARPGVFGWARGLQFPSSGSDPYGIGGLRNEVVIGAAVKFDQAAESNVIFEFFLSTNAAKGSAGNGDLTNIYVQASLRLLHDGRLAICHGASPTVLAVTDATKIVHFDSYNFIEWKVQFGTAGYSEVRLDGVVVQSGNVMVSDVPVTIGTITTVNRDKAEGFLISGAGGGGTPVAYDDLYILEVGASPNNDFLSDSRINIFMPSANGTTNNFTPVGSATNWQNVNEIPGDSDTTYNYGTASGQIDEYAHTTLTPSTLVLSGVQVWQRVKDPDAASTQYVPIVDDNGTVYVDLADTQTGQSVYSDTQKIFNVTTGTTSWTPTNFNSATFGIKQL